MHKNDFYIEQEFQEILTVFHAANILHDTQNDIEWCVNYGLGILHSTRICSR